MGDDPHEDEEQKAVVPMAAPVEVRHPIPATSSEAIGDAIPLVKAAQLLKREPVHLVRLGAAGKLEVCVWLTEAQLSRTTWSDDIYEGSLGEAPITSTGLYRVPPKDLGDLVGQQTSIRIGHVLERETSPRGAGDPSAVPKGNVSLCILRSGPTTHDKSIVISHDSLYIHRDEWRAYQEQARAAQGQGEPTPGDLDPRSVEYSERRDVVLAMVLQLLCKHSRFRFRIGDPARPNVSALINEIQKWIQQSGGGDLPNFEAGAIRVHLKAALDAAERAGLKMPSGD
jgi:hypothetical protein